MLGYHEAFVTKRLFEAPKRSGFPKLKLGPGASARSDSNASGLAEGCGKSSEWASLDAGFGPAGGLFGRVWAVELWGSRRFQPSEISG